MFSQSPEAANTFLNKELSYIHVDGIRASTRLKDWKCLLSVEDRASNTGGVSEHDEIYFREGRFLYVKSGDVELHWPASLITRSEALAASEQLSILAKDFEWIRDDDVAFGRLGSTYRWYVLRLAAIRLSRGLVQVSGKSSWDESYVPSNKAIRDRWHESLFASTVFEFAAATRHFDRAALSPLALAMSELLVGALAAINESFEDLILRDEDMPIEAIPISAEADQLIQATRAIIDIMFPSDQIDRFDEVPREYKGRRDKFERDLFVYLLVSTRKFTNAQIKTRLPLFGLPEMESVNSVRAACKRIEDRLGMPPAPNRSGRPHR